MSRAAGGYPSSDTRGNVTKVLEHDRERVGRLTTVSARGVFGRCFARSSVFVGLPTKRPRFAVVSASRVGLQKSAGGVAFENGSQGSRQEASSERKQRAKASRGRRASGKAGAESWPEEGFLSMEGAPAVFRSLVHASGCEGSLGFRAGAARAKAIVVQTRWRLERQRLGPRSCVAEDNAARIERGPAEVKRAAVKLPFRW